MSRPGLSELLIRAALDFEFRERVLSEPDAVFAEFDLSNAQQEILRRRDSRMEELVGAAVRAGMRSHSESRTEGDVPVAASGSAAAAPSPAAKLRDAKLLLQVVPYVQHDADGAIELTYAAALHSLPDGTDPDSVPLPEETLPGSQLQPLKLVIQVAPSWTADSGGRRQVAFSCFVREHSAAETLRAPADDSPWNHRSDSEAARQAAAAVRAASPHEQFDRLLDLVDALQGGDVDD